MRLRIPQWYSAGREGVNNSCCMSAMLVDPSLLAVAFRWIIVPPLLGDSKGHHSSEYFPIATLTACSLSVYPFKEAYMFCTVKSKCPWFSPQPSIQDFFDELRHRWMWYGESFTPFHACLGTAVYPRENALSCMSLARRLDGRVQP